VTDKADFQSHESKTRAVVEDENTVKIFPKSNGGLLNVQGSALVKYNAMDIIL
jgi:hypothetical protein